MHIHRLYNYTRDETKYEEQKLWTLTNSDLQPYLAVKPKDSGVFPKRILSLHSFPATQHVILDWCAKE